MVNVVKDFIEKELLNFEIDDAFLEFNKKLFQVKKGGYGENDVVLGIRNPILRKIAKKYYDQVSLEDILYFLKSPIHEYRSFALMMLVLWDVESSIDVYMNNLDFVNNWDLVDLSAPNILGKYLNKYDDETIYLFLKDLYNNDKPFVRRVAIVSTLYLIRNERYEIVLKFFKLVLDDDFLLNHKALGWMLREIYKKNCELTIQFLKENDVSNIAFNYATEKMDKELKQILKNK